MVLCEQKGGEEFIERLIELLREDSSKPARHRRSAQPLFEHLQHEGYEGGYDAIRRYVGDLPGTQMFQGHET